MGVADTNEQQCRRRWESCVWGDSEFTETEGEERKEKTYQMRVASVATGPSSWGMRMNANMSPRLYHTDTVRPDRCSLVCAVHCCAHTLTSLIHTAIRDKEFRMCVLWEKESVFCLLYCSPCAWYRTGWDSLQSLSSYAGYMWLFSLWTCVGTGRDFTFVQLGKECSPSYGVARPRDSGTRTPVASHENEERRGNKILGFMCFWSEIRVITEPDVGKKNIVIGAVWISLSITIGAAL